MKKALVLASLLVVFSACTKRGAPSVHAGRPAPEVVKTFVELSAGAKTEADRKRLQELCSGDMARTFERMNDEAFRLIYLDSKITILELKMLEVKEDGNTARVAYQLTVDNKQGTDPTREVNQREVEMTRVDNAWFINSIRMRGSDQVAFTRGMLF